MAILEAIEQHAYLGTEFLTWLWWKGETGRGLFKLPDLGEADIVVDTMALATTEDDGDVRAAQFKGDAPGGSPLLRDAIAEGRKISRATMRVVWENIAWSVTVNGETLDLSGIKLPVASRGNAAEVTRLRLDTLESFLSLWERIFAEYMAVRVDATAWADESDNFVAWLIAGSTTGPTAVASNDDQE